MQVSQLTHQYSRKRDIEQNFLATQAMANQILHYGSLQCTSFKRDGDQIDHFAQHVHHTGLYVDALYDNRDNVPAANFLPEQSEEVRVVLL